MTDIISRLLNEKTQVYETLKVNCVEVSVSTGYCHDCHQVHNEIVQYKHDTLGIDITKVEENNPIVDNSNIIENDSTSNNLQQQEITINNNVPLFL